MTKTYDEILQRAWDNLFKRDDIHAPLPASHWRPEARAIAFEAMRLAQAAERIECVKELEDLKGVLLPAAARQIDGAIAYLRTPADPRKLHICPVCAYGMTGLHAPWCQIAGICGAPEKPRRPAGAPWGSLYGDGVPSCWADEPGATAAEHPANKVSEPLPPKDWRDVRVTVGMMWDALLGLTESPKIGTFVGTIMQNATRARNG